MYIFWYDYASLIDFDDEIWNIFWNFYEVNDLFPSLSIKESLCFGIPVYFSDFFPFIILNF